MKLIYFMLSTVIILGLILLGSEGTEADNTFTAYGKTYKITKVLKVHSVTIDDVHCIVVGRDTSPAITCDWENKK